MKLFFPTVIFSQGLFVAWLILLILFEKDGTRITESVLSPWIALCETVTPVAWQTRGNILLGLSWLFSGMSIYSAIIGFAVVGLISILRQIWK